MSGVVRRCPHCGTMQEAEGECEACHEASVQYYCSNHSPGAWLETEACPRCGARFGDPSPPSPIKLPPTHTGEIAAHELRPAPPVADPGSERGPWDADVAAESYGDSRRGPVADPFRVLLGAMAAAARARAERSGSVGHDRPRHAPRRGCCLGQVLMIFLFLAVLVLMAPVFLGALLGFR